MQPTPNPTRRTVLKAALGLVAAPHIASAAAAPSATPRTGRTLILLHLAGGNDGLNTIIPYADPMYYELRPRLSKAARGVLPIDGRVGFHPALAPLVPLFDQGRLAIIQGVGYPDPDYSHVGSCRIWTTGQREPADAEPWWQRILAYQPSMSACATAVSAVPSNDDVRSRTAETAVAPGPIARSLANVAQSIASPHPPAVVSVRMDGFDTHADQLPTHARLLGELAEALATFQADIESRGLADRVMLMAWSEFGRRPAENAANGTDHGTAGPVFVLGKNVRGGLHGRAPSLRDTDFGNLLHTVDFRRAYETTAVRWLNYPIATAAQSDRTLAFV